MPKMPGGRTPSGHTTVTHRMSVVLRDWANAVADVRDSLRAAERAGMPDDDVRRLDALLGARSVPPSVLLRAEREVRAWFGCGRSH